MTKRQLEVLRMARDAINKSEPWINLCLTKGAESQITFEECNWVTEFEQQAMLTRIDAALLVDEVVHISRSKVAAPVCTPYGCTRD